MNSPTSKNTHYISIDILRAIAFLLVFLYHAEHLSRDANTSTFYIVDKIISSIGSIGWIGVDIFFLHQWISNYSRADKWWLYTTQYKNILDIKSSTNSSGILFLLSSDTHIQHIYRYSNWYWRRKDSNSGILYLHQQHILFLPRS